MKNELTTNTALTTRKGVRKYLEEYHVYTELMYDRADYDTAIDLVDFHNAVLMADLTDKQVLFVRYAMQGYTTREIGEKVDLKHNSVNDTINRACDKIAEIYQEWQRQEAVSA